jgi:AraC-like DNA-binding protein
VQRASWIADHLGDDLSVPVMAAGTSMSVWNFSRRFAQESGNTPAAYFEAVRVEAGRRLRGSFRCTVRVTPGQYRQHFSPRTAT